MNKPPSSLNDDDDDTDNGCDNAPLQSPTTITIISDNSNDDNSSSSSSNTFVWNFDNAPLQLPTTTTTTTITSGDDADYSSSSSSNSNMSVWNEIFASAEERERELLMNIINPSNNTLRFSFKHHVPLTFRVKKRNNNRYLVANYYHSISHSMYLYCT